MKSAAISAAFSFVRALGEFCSPASKTYSRVPPSLAAPRYRNSSMDIAGTANRRVIRIVARERMGQFELNSESDPPRDLELSATLEERRNDRQAINVHMNIFS